MMCLTLVRYLLDRHYRVDLILLQYRGSRLSEIPDGTNLFILDSKFRRRRRFEKCSLPTDQVHWVKLPMKARIFKYLSALRSYIKVLNTLGSIRLKFRLRHFQWTTVMVKYLNSEMPDVIYANSFHTGTISVFGSLVSSGNVPVIWAVRNRLIHTLNETNMLYFKHLIRKASRVHTNSRGGAREVIELVPEVVDRTLAIHNPISPQVKLLARQKVEHRWLETDSIAHFEHRPKIILAVGRLTEQKNFSMLTRAFAVVQSQMDVCLILLGDGKKRNVLRELARNLNIENFVSMPGFVPNPYAFMAHADLFVLSSSWEGCPNVLIEALTCGCPVVSTDCESGPREILDNGKYGRLVPVNDHAALAEAIVETLMQPPDREALKRRAQQFCPDIVMKHYEEMFNNVISESSVE